MLQQVICMSMTLRCHDHTDWNSSKIISRLVSLGVCSLQTSTSHIYSKGNNPKLCAGIGSGYKKSVFQCTKYLMSLKCGKIVLGLLPRTNRKPRLLRKSTTLEDPEGSLCSALFQNKCAMVFSFTFSLLLVSFRKLKQLANNYQSHWA